MIDYHLHPNFSIDAQGTVSEFCEAALEKGLEIICFTTHVDTDPKRDDGVVRVGHRQISTRRNEWLNPYVNAIRDAESLYEERGLEVHLGAEVDFYPGFEHNLPEAFWGVDWDYVLGAMHLLEHRALSLEKEALEVFKDHSIEDLAELYYGNLIGCVESGLFDAIAHIDIYRRYGEEFYGKKIHSVWESHISDLADAMRRKNVGFEINTSSLRKGLAEPMPAKRLIQGLHKEGVETVTVGSDAHSPIHVGYEIPTALDILKECGFEEVTCFRKRKPFAVQLIEYR